MPLLHISAADEKNGKYGRLYVRFRLSGNGPVTSPAQLVMLRNAYPEGAPKLIYPNAVVVPEGAFVEIDIVVRDNPGDVGCGFTMRAGASPGPSDKETRPIVDKLYAVGPASKGPDGAPRWRVDHVQRYQVEANQISLESVARLEQGNSTTTARAKLIPRSRCDIYAWSVKAYNDLDEGDAYSGDYLPPGEGQPPFGKDSRVKPMPLAELDSSATFSPPASSAVDSPRQAFKKVEIQRELASVDQRLGVLSVHLFVFAGNNTLPAAPRAQPVSIPAKLAAACPRGKAA